jgi:hypothetical protein
MPRRASQITQADVARVIRAAKLEGVPQVKIKIGEVPFELVRPSQSYADTLILFLPVQSLRPGLIRQ